MKMEVINVSKQKQEANNTEYKEDFILNHQNSLKIQRVDVYVFIIKTKKCLKYATDCAEHFKDCHRQNPKKTHPI